VIGRAFINRLASAAQAAWRGDRWDAVAVAVAVLVAEECAKVAESATRTAFERGYTPEQTGGWVAREIRARFGQPGRPPT